MVDTIDVRDLSEEDVKKVKAYIASLRVMTPKKKKHLKFDWAGGLAHLKDKHTSVELQHESLNWR